MDASAQVSPAVVKAVAKELKKYMRTGRRENGFDDSQPGQVGAFSSTKGGSLYYSALQDKHLRRYFDKPSTKKHLFTTGTIPEHLLSPVERRAQLRLLRSDLRDPEGDDRLVHTAAGLLVSGEWNAAKSSSRGKGRHLETPLWSPSSTSCSSSPAHSSRCHSNNSTVVLSSAVVLPTASVSEPHSNDSEPTFPQLKDEGEEGSSSSIADVAATGSQQSLHASRPCSATDGSSKPVGSPTPSVPPAHSKHSKCSQGTQTIEDKVVQVDVVSTVDCGVHVPGTVEQATQTCPESGVQTDLSYLMQHCCSSYTAEERQGPSSIRQTNVAAMSMHKEIACHWEEVQGSVGLTEMAKGLNGSEQTQRRRDPSVVLGALSPDLPREEGRRVGQQPSAVVSGGEQSDNLSKPDAEGAMVTEEEGGMGGNETRGGDEALALEDKRVSGEHEAFQSERNML